MVVDGFFATIHCSLNFLLDSTEPRPDMMPLFEAQMELQGADMLFNPSLDYGVADGFYDLIDGLVGDIYKQASKINRLAAHSGQEHYQVANAKIGLVLIRRCIHKIMYQLDQEETLEIFL